MTNFEYWKDRILEINENENIGIVNGKPVKCNSIENCEDCELCTTVKSCRQKFVEWLYSEHEEKLKLTMAERILCEAIDFPEYKEITRANGYLFIGRKGKLEVSINPCMFKFIEEGNPWMVENLLLLEV